MMGQHALLAPSITTGRGPADGHNARIQCIQPNCVSSPVAAQNSASLCTYMLAAQQQLLGLPGPPAGNFAGARRLAGAHYRLADSLRRS